MSPTTLKTIMTIGAAIAGALAFVPQLVPYQAAFTALAGFLGGGAHVPQPGAKAELAAVKGALAAAVEAEK